MVSGAYRGKPEGKSCILALWLNFFPKHFRGKVHLLQPQRKVEMFTKQNCPLPWAYALSHSKKQHIFDINFSLTWARWNLRQHSRPHWPSPLRSQWVCFSLSISTYMVERKNRAVLCGMYQGWEEDRGRTRSLVLLTEHCLHVWYHSTACLLI